MVKPKKHLGQHFLKDESVAAKIADSLTGDGDYLKLIEIGPGTGVLTKYLIQKNFDLTLVELDNESVDYLSENEQFKETEIVKADFLTLELPFYKTDRWGIIGNFPYNISSQIFFKVLDYHDNIQEVVCMIQKEVAQRISSPPGNKTYGILSVLLQAFYDIEFLFTVPPEVFRPPPKVESAVIRLRRNSRVQLDCDETLFRRIVKQGFQNRRKTLRNALKPLNLPAINEYFNDSTARAEELSVEDFERLTRIAQ